MNIYKSSIINFSQAVDMPINFIDKVCDITFFMNRISTTSKIYDPTLLTIYAYEFNTINIKYFFLVENEFVAEDIYEINENIYTQLIPVCSNLFIWYIYCLHNRNISLYSVSHKNQEILFLHDGNDFYKYISLLKPITSDRLIKLREQLNLINTPNKLINLIESHIFIKYL